MLVFILLSVGNVYAISQPVPSGGYLQEMAAILNGCTDEASQVPENLIQTESNISHLVGKRIPTLATLIVIGVVVNVILVVIYGLTYCGLCKKEVQVSSINTE